MRLPIGARSRAVLLGSAAYEHLPLVPAVEANLRTLHEVLVEVTGLPWEHCSTLLNTTDLTTVGAEVTYAAREAADLLLVYYAGHGLVDSEGALHLALPHTSQESLPWTGLPFDYLRRSIRDSPARTRVVILDCCFSGRATEQTLAAFDDLIRGQVRVMGSFSLASSPANSPSYATGQTGHTAFTGALLTVLHDGSPTAGSLLTLNEIYIELVRLSHDQGFPRPEKCGTHTADLMALAPNPQANSDSGTTTTGQSLPDEQMAPEGSSQVEREALEEILRSPTLTADAIRLARFTPVRLREGYDMGEVDALLDKVEDALQPNLAALEKLSDEDVQNAMFTPVRLNEGYDMQEVDDFLDQVVSELRRRRDIARRHLGTL